MKMNKNRSKESRSSLTKLLDKLNQTKKQRKKSNRKIQIW